MLLFVASILAIIRKKSHFFILKWVLATLPNIHSNKNGASLTLLKIDLKTVAVEFLHFFYFAAITFTANRFFRKLKVNGTQTKVDILTHLHIRVWA